MELTFKKSERLCSKIIIEKLYKEGSSFLSYPLRFVYIKLESESKDNNQVLITASKKTFKRAVDRNLIKRRIREAYRLHKHSLHDFKDLTFAINYIGKQIEDFSKIEEQVIKGFETIKKRIVQTKKSTENV